KRIPREGNGRPWGTRCSCCWWPSPLLCWGAFPPPPKWWASGRNWMIRGSRAEGCPAHWKGSEPTAGGSVFIRRRIHKGEGTSYIYSVQIVRRRRRGKGAVGVLFAHTLKEGKAWKKLIFLKISPNEPAAISTSEWSERSAPANRRSSNGLWKRW